MKLKRSRGTHFRIDAQKITTLFVLWHTVRNKEKEEEHYEVPRLTPEKSLRGRLFNSKNDKEEENNQEDTTYQRISKES